MTFHLVALGCLTVSGAFMAWSDLKRRRLPNMANAAIAVAGLVTSLSLLGPHQTLGHLFHAMIALGLGVLVYAAGVTGSGDAKYYAAVATWFPFTESLRLISWISLVGFLLGMIWLVTSPLEGPDLERGGDFSKVPFGIAIACGAVLSVTGLLG